MTPKEKAKELVDKFREYSFTKTSKINVAGHDLPYIDTLLQIYNAKKCALIAVEELINTESLAYRMCEYTNLTTEHLQYWQEVKNEIKQL